jgi:hypothetical protein
MSLDILTMRMCEDLQGRMVQIGSHKVEIGLNKAWCDCKGFHFKKRCKHLEEAQKEICTWHQQWCDEIYVNDNKCPRCGGPTVPCRVAV